MNTNPDIIETMAKGNSSAKIWAEYESLAKKTEQVADFASCYLLQRPLGPLDHDESARSEFEQLRWTGLNDAQLERFNTLLDKLRELRSGLLEGLVTAGYPMSVIDIHKADIEGERLLVSKMGNEYLEMKDRFTDNLVHLFIMGNQDKAMSLMEAWDKNKARLIEQYK